MSALLAVQQEASGYLDNIRAKFKPGVKITLLVRSPGFPERDFVMTDDALPEIAAMIQRRAESAP